MTIHLRRILVAACAAGLVVLAIGGVVRAVPSPQISGVFQADACGGEACEPGVDRGIKKGASVDGTIQIHVSVTNDIRPIEWVRLEARYGDQPQFICLQHWVADQTTFSGYYNWVTPDWPDPTINSNCIENAPHYHGQQTRNGTFQMRVVARERRVATEDPEGHDGYSSLFTIQINNPAAAPVWASDPSVSSGDRPAVTLQWQPNDERDLREYLIIRQDPSGRETETPVSATKPQQQGCARLGDAAIKCIDNDFRGRYGGTYRYAIIAVRAASAGKQRCTLSDRRCIESALSEPKSVTVAGPVAPGAPTPTPSAGPSTIALPTAFPTPGRFSGSVFPTPQPTVGGGGTGELAVPAGTSQPLGRRGLLGPAAFVAALALTAWQVRRALLARR